MKKILSLLLAIIVLVGMTSIMASAAEPAKQAYVMLGSLDAQNAYASIGLTVTEGGPPAYALNDENGVAFSAGASEGNYNVKLEYPEGGPVVLYLKDANLKNNRQSALTVGTPSWLPTIKDFDIKVVVETDSTLTGCQHPTIDAGYTGITFGNSGDAMITGPGKLSIYSETAQPIVTRADLIIKDANIYAQALVTNMSRAVIWANGANITIDNSKVELKNGFGGRCLYISDDYHTLKGDPYNITIQNKSEVIMSNDSYSAVVECLGEIVFDDSTVEITAKDRCFNSAPILKNVGAVAGTKATNAKTFNEKKFKSYQYFKCGADIVAETLPPETTAPTTQPTEATKPTEVTQPTETTKPTEVTKPTEATKPAETKPAETKPADTQPAETKPATNKPAGNNTTSGSGIGNLIVWILIGILVLVNIGVLTFIVISYKKKVAAPVCECADEAAEEIVEESIEEINIETEE